MAAPKSRPRDGYPGRALALILVVTVGLVALMFGTGHKTPRLGIDLAGGTSITLTASSQDKAAINQSNMDIAVGIIQKRVNAFGVSEAEVQTQGNDNIIVDIPKGTNSAQAAKQVGTTAKLYFRPVLAEAPTGVTLPPASPSAQPSASGSASPSAGASASASGSTAASASAGSPSAGAGTPSASASASKAGKALSEGLLAADPSGTPSAGASGAATPPSGAAASGSPSAPASALPPVPTAPADISAALTSGTVPPDLAQQFTALDCSNPTQRIDYQQADPTKNTVACSYDKEKLATGGNGWYKFALGPVQVKGQDVTKATAGFDTQQAAGWQVQLSFNDAGSKAFASTTGALAAQQSPANQFAIVLDGQVVSHPMVSQSITGGNAVINGSFSQDDATSLANVLSFGALPLSFNQSDVTTVSPQLGGDQLHAGLLAGAIGLALVVLYSLIYYRGLGLVSIAGLVVSSILTYTIMCLLGASIGFALNLPAVCGAIVAIGITADSFIVYFERIRDEVREGAQLRPAVQRAWPRARRTILVSDFVSLLCAAVLYICSVGKVQGFAFTLGLTTVLDVVVIFLFTKPMITLLARRKFFASGHPWSGLDPKRLGARPPVRGGRRRPATSAAVKEA